MSCITHNNLCPSSGDTENVLLQKILQSLNEGGGGGGGGVTGISVNGGPLLTGNVSIATGSGVQSVNGDAGPIVSLDSGEIPEGVNLYYTAARFNTAFAAKSTTDLAEGTNQYFTEARVRAALLTGLVVAGGAITAADSVLSAFGKTQFRLNALETGASGPFVLRAGDTMTGPLTITPSATDVMLLDLNSFSLTGATALPALRITGEWNTTGAPTIFDVDVANTASSANSLLFNFKLSTTTVLNLRRDGRLLLNGRAAFTTTSAIGHVLFVSDANTASAALVLGLTHNLSSGTAAAGIGINFDQSIDSTTTVSTRATRWQTTWTDATHATRTAQTAFFSFVGGAEITSLILANGQVQGNPGSVALPSFVDRTNVDLGIYFPANQVAFSVNGVQIVNVGSTGLTVASGQIFSPDGTAALPAHSFTSDPNTGIFSAGADQIGLSTGGVVRITVSTTGITFALPLLMPDGTAALPAYSFASDPNTGIFQTGVADTIGISTGGVVRVTLNTVNLSSTLPILAPDGTAALPAYSFTSDPNTGIFQTGVADTLGISTGGVTRWTLNTTSLTTTLQFLAAVGTAALPTYSFSADPNTGIFQTGVADTLGLSTGGVVRVTLNTVNFASTLPYLAPLGAVGAPAYSFTGDTDTGMYSSAGDTLNLSTGAVARLAIFGGTSIVTTLPIQGQAGSAATPAFSFSGDPDTGIYDVSADVLGFSVGGVLRKSISTTQVISTLVNVGPAGTAALPTFSFSGDPNTGIYNVGADQLGISTGGTLRITYSTTDTIHAAGYRLAISSGTNQRAGNATLVAGTVTVANTSVTANTIVLLTRKTSGGTIGTAITYTVSAATSFTITSDSVLDTSVFSYFLIEVP